MSKLQKRVMQRFFREAQGDPTRLPWHDDTPSPLLQRAIAEGTQPKRALDVGCGSGFLSAYMAERGLEVTAVDYLAEAVEMARAHAKRRGVELDVLETDVLGYQPEQGFGLVHDSGCLHNMSGRELSDYRSRLLDWLEPGGDYVLGHWGRRHLLDWRPIGPRRRTPEELANILGPELELLDAQHSDEPAPLPFGPRVRMASYWFRRAGQSSRGTSISA